MNGLRTIQAMVPIQLMVPPLFQEIAESVMQVPDIETSWNMIDRGGVVALLFLGLVFLWTAFQFGWIVPAYVYKAEKDSKNEWRDQSKGTVEAVKALTEEFREWRIAQQQLSAGAAPRRRQ